MTSGHLNSQLTGQFRFATNWRIWSHPLKSVDLLQAAWFLIEADELR
jgi:hypothetical protein